MRSLVSIILFVLMNNSQAFTQQTNPQQFSLEGEYLQKSKNKKRTGWIFLGTGVAAMAVGIPLLASGDKSLNDLDAQMSGAFIAAVGGGLSLTSVFFFEASSKYKRKAAALSFQFEKVLQPYEYGFVQTAFPAVKLKIAL